MVFKTPNYTYNMKPKPKKAKIVNSRYHGYYYVNDTWYDPFGSIVIEDMLIESLVNLLLNEDYYVEDFPYDTVDPSSLVGIDDVDNSNFYSETQSVDDVTVGDSISNVVDDSNNYTVDSSSDDSSDFSTDDF